MATAVILSIGDELTTGQTVDTNSAWIARKLAERGVKVIRHLTVGDELGQVEKAFRDAIGTVGLVVATGGLGATEDDVTREGLARALGQALHEDAEGLRMVTEWFARVDRPMPESNRRQALLPVGSRPVPNRRGIAPGIECQSGGTLIFALPGVPVEMTAMVEESVLARLEVAFDARVTRIRCVWTAGMSEAAVGEAIADLMRRGREPAMGTTAHGMVVGVRIVASAAEAREADALLAADEVEIRRRLGDAVFGTDETRLQDAVARLLLDQKRTVATAESCTGGLLAGRLTDVAGSSAYFLRGYVTYSNQAKRELHGVPDAMLEEHGAVSEPVARAMAVGCRAASGADLAVSITGIAGPGGGSPEKPVGLVYVGLADAQGVSVERRLFGENWHREEIRDRTCKLALNKLRLKLLELGRSSDAVASKEVKP